MKSDIGMRIRSARLLAGFSLRELSKRLEGLVSHTAINKYEKGTLIPDGKALIALSKALDVNTDFFLRPITLKISQIEFRKRSKLLVKDINSIKETVMDTVERYVELESFLNLNDPFVNPISDLAIATAFDVELAVEQLLDVWDIGTNAIPNVIELLEDKEIKVIELDASDQFDGLSGWANGIIPVIVINKNFSVERKRFTALHELGHLLLNCHDELGKKEIEKMCHRFAGAVLLPKSAIFSELGEKRNAVSINELIFIKESYGISIQAIMARAKDLGIISNDHYVRFRMRVNQNVNLKKEIGYGNFKSSEQSTRFKQLLYRAASEEIITFSKAASLANLKLAEFRDELMAI